MSAKHLLGVALWLGLFGLACQNLPANPSPTSNSGPTTSAETTATLVPPVVVTLATPDSYPYPVATATLPGSPYPAPNTPIPTAYPVAPSPSATPSATPIPAVPTIGSSNDVYLPWIDAPVATATAAAVTPTPLLPPSPTPYPTVDFAAERARLQAQGQELGYSKIGFHMGVGGNSVGIGDWMRRLDAAGVPFFLKSVDNSGPILEAVGLKLASGVDHTIIFRTTGNDVPNYALPAVEAARQHWQWHRDRFPPELEPYKDQIWLETMNELDKNRSEWLAEFALEQARLAEQEGFRWAAFAWSTGEPEVDDWTGPKMLQFLQLAGANPDRIAVALHEGSLVADNITDGYPFKVGRFLSLFDVCDRYGIPRPTVLITEWGWQSHSMPNPDKAMADISWAARLYAPYPQVKGVAIWHLGIGYDPIQNMAQSLIAPLTQFSLTHFYPIPAPPDQASTDPNQYQP